MTAILVDEPIDCACLMVADAFIEEAGHSRVKALRYGFP
jgi:hypothetical protein